MRWEGRELEDTVGEGFDPAGQTGGAWVDG